MVGLKVVMIVANKKARHQHLKVKNVFESYIWLGDGGADSGLRSEDGVVQCTYVANREAKK